jgi:hypothetical protein
MRSSIVSSMRCEISRVASCRGGARARAWGGGGGALRRARALARFEEGVHLARRGNVLLDRVEQRVEMLLADRDETVPLPTAADDEDVP